MHRISFKTPGDAKFDDSISLVFYREVAADLIKQGNTPYQSDCDETYWDFLYWKIVESETDKCGIATTLVKIFYELLNEHHKSQERKIEDLALARWCSLIMPCLARIEYPNSFQSKETTIIIQSPPPEPDPYDY